MVLYTIKNLRPMKVILKTLPSGGIENCIEMQKEQHSKKATVKDFY